MTSWISYRDAPFFLHSGPKGRNSIAQGAALVADIAGSHLAPTGNAVKDSYAEKYKPEAPASAFIRPADPCTRWRFGLVFLHLASRSNP